MWQLIHTPHIGIKAARLLESIISLQEDDSLKTQLHHALHLLMEVTSLLENGSMELERQLKDIKQQNFTTRDEYDTFLKARKSGDSTHQTK